MKEVSDSVILKSPPWLKFEKQFSIYRSIQCKKTVGRSLGQAIKQRMRESSLGSFLLHLNRSQHQERFVQQDKLDRVIFDIGKRLVNLNKLGRQNDICDDLLTLIEELIWNDEAGTITIQSFLRGTKVLRLTGSHVVEMDKSVRDLQNLRALVLSGNCLSQVPGDHLPRGLLLLELCYNNLHDLSSLRDCPPCLLYLGLARNNLTLTRNLRSLGLDNLCHLDLSQNDIDDLIAVVEDCSYLDNLSSLLLVGNPCSMVASYKDVIASKLTKLSLLDGIRIKTVEKGELEHDLSGTLRLSLYRLLSFPQPPTQKINKKKVIHTFRIEVDFPRLRSFVPKLEENFIEDPTINELDNSKQNKKIDESKKGKQQKEIKLQPAPKLKNTNKKTKAILKTKNEPQPDKKIKLKSMTKTGSKEDLVRSDEMIEYESYLKELPETDMHYISGSKPWSKIIEFDDPTIEITNCSLNSLRDTFMAYVVINIVHLKTLPATKSKVSGKKKTKKSTEENKKEANQNKDILISKTTVAKVRVPLQQVVWNVTTLDYIWCKNKPLKVEQSSGLKDLKYSVKNKNKKKNLKDEKGISELKIPSECTCHFGIGLKRTEINEQIR